MARDLRKEFLSIINVPHSGPISAGAFVHVDNLIRSLEEMDPQNGHALYFSGEVKRKEGLIQAAEEAFFKYLEVQDTIPDSEKGGDTGAEICYKRPGGYCRQRSGWIHHLLANDYYSAGVSEKDPNRKIAYFQEALGQVGASRRDYPPGFGQPGGSTGQLEPTTTLESKLPTEIEALEKILIKGNATQSH